MRILKALLLPLLLIISLLGVDQLHAAGDMTRRPVALPDLVLGSDDSDYFMSPSEYQLETDQAYQLRITSNGQKEYAFQAAEFTTAISLRKVEAGGVAVKAVTLTELEFEDAGEAEVFFLPVKPGTFRFYARGLEGKGMLGHLVVR